MTDAPPVYDPNEPRRWTVSEGDLVGLDNTKARDLIERCFYEAQHETYVRLKKLLGVIPEDEAVRRGIATAVRAAIERSGGDYERPTKASLYGAIEVLAERAASWGTPADIFEHHTCQIEHVLEHLPDDDAGA